MRLRPTPDAYQFQPAHADENGVSLWVPGLFGSLAAAPAVAGWSLGTVAYHITLAASGNVAAARQISIGQVPVTANVNLNANLNVRGPRTKEKPRQLPAGGSPSVSSLSGSEVTLSANVQEHSALVLELVDGGWLGSRRCQAACTRELLVEEERTDFSRERQVLDGSPARHHTDLSDVEVWVAAKVRTLVTQATSSSDVGGAQSPLADSSPCISRGETNSPLVLPPLQCTATSQSRGGASPYIRRFLLYA